MNNVDFAKLKVGDEVWIAPYAPHPYRQFKGIISEVYSSEENEEDSVICVEGNVNEFNARHVFLEPFPEKKIDRLGEITDGEHRLVGAKTKSLITNDRGYTTITTKLEVQLPFTGNVFDFEFVRNINPYKEQTFEVKFTGEEAKSKEQLGRWLAAAAFAMETLDQMPGTEIKIYS